MALLSGASSLVLAQIPTGVVIKEQSIAGLTEPAEIIIDHWGIPHIYAASDRDALFLQGYNAARDRLWQIDLWRKRGLGLLAANFGEKFVAQDRAARMFLYRGDMDKEWQAYGPNGRAFAEAFVAGVNAYVQKVLDGELPLPLEFQVTNTKPDSWNVEDAVRIRSHGLTRNMASEVRRAQVACAADLETDTLRTRLEPEWETSIPRGLDPCIIPVEVLADYRLATALVDLSTLKDDKVAAVDYQEYMREIENNTHLIGSNNWVVAPSHTDTGRPILADDPHRAHSVPSVRYIVHLNSPNMSVIGAGEPSLPGISIGHNGRIAFGLTIFATDQEDLYVYEINPRNPNQYRYNGRWVDMEVVTETVAVRDGAPKQITMRFTRHGPVLYVDENRRRAFAVRTVWLEPGTSAYFGSVDYMTAKNWDEFTAAMRRFATPSENQVYADVDGNIGWAVGSITPQRANWDGLLPVPGDGRYEWKFLDPSELPSVFNPEQGWYANANQMNLPEGYPYRQRKIGFEWSDPSRYERIVEALSTDKAHSMTDSMALQVDDHSMLGRRIVRLVKELNLPAGAHPTVEKALDLLRQWDGVVSIDSGAAVISELMITRFIGNATIARVVPEDVRALIGNGNIQSVLMLLETASDKLGANPRSVRNEILLEALTQAVNQAVSLLGDNVSNWQWGMLHKGYFENMVSPLVAESLAEQLNVGPLAMGGAGSTPRAAGYNESFRVTAGASFRMVLDVGNWDASRTINSPGQSGDPFSPHYRDLAPLWASGQYIPLSYSREAVERNASVVLKVTPAASGL